MHRPFRIGLPKIHRRFCMALLKSTDGSILALLRLPSIFSCLNSTVAEFWCTMAIRQDERRDIRSNIHFCLKEFLRAKPEGTSSRVYHFNNH